MDPVIGAALIGGAVSGYGAYRANRQTAASTARQMAFQERMSNTAHQRQMADLKKAGINPMLSAKLGGASSPAGASYQASNVGAAAVEGYGKVSSAKQVQAQTRLTQSQTNKVITETKRLIPAQVRKLDAEGILAKARVSQTEAQTAITVIQRALLLDDQKMLAKLGLSQMQLKHAPLNQAGSMAIDAAVEAARETPRVLREAYQEATKFVKKGWETDKRRAKFIYDAAREYLR
jgi:hypothetical protein